MKAIRAVLAVFCAATLGACGNDTGPSDVVGIEWKVTSLQRTGSTRVEITGSDQRYTLRLNPDGTAGLFADCNQCGARFTLTENKLAITLEACTLIYCGTESHEDAYLDILEGPGTLDRSGDTLVLQSPRDASLPYSVVGGRIPISQHSCWRTRRSTVENLSLFEIPTASR